MARTAAVVLLSLGWPSWMARLLGGHQHRMTDGGEWLRCPGREWPWTHPPQRVLRLVAGHLVTDLVPNIFARSPVMVVMYPLVLSQP